MKRILIIPLLSILVANCAGPVATPAGSLTGVKDVNLAVNTDHDLDTAPGYMDGSSGIERILFPTRLISSNTAPDGVTTATFELLPTTDADEVQGMPAKYRVIPTPSQITVRSKKLAGIPLADIAGLKIATMGRYKGRVCMMSLSQDIYALELQVKTSNKGMLTYRNPNSQTVHQVPLDDTDGRRGLTPKAAAQHKNQEFSVPGIGYKWQPSTSSWTGDPQLYLGDGGASVFLDGGGWHLESNGAGPPGSDFSYLETKTTRGEFD